MGISDARTASKPVDDLLSVAGRLELDPAETDAALQARRFRERVLADIEGGRQAGVHATPTFPVDGESLGRRWRELRKTVGATLATPCPPGPGQRRRSERTDRRGRAAPPRHSEISRSAIPPADQRRLGSGIRLVRSARRVRPALGLR